MVKVLFNTMFLTSRLSRSTLANPWLHPRHQVLLGVQGRKVVTMQNLRLTRGVMTVRVKLSRSFSSNNSSKFWDAVSDDSNFNHQESSWPMRDILGFFYHQYFEMSAPYWRVPLMEKVTEMAQTYPSLKTRRSIDLSPASWMVVACLSEQQSGSCAIYIM